MTHNRRAVDLHERAGFPSRAGAQSAFSSTAGFVDELYLATLLPGGHSADSA
jgi:hypothetical protein